MKILLVDNYDSFTFNLVHYIEAVDCEVSVLRNDDIQLRDIHQFDKIVLSPGPGLPKESNQLMEIIREFIEKKPVLGVCLGFQAIVEHFNGKLYNQDCVKHGLEEKCRIDGKSKLFKGIPDNIKVGLYHSWAANEMDFPTPLRITARSENNVIMAFEHEELPVCGVQFHPESILTEHGQQLVNNFLFHFD